MGGMGSTVFFQATHHFLNEASPPEFILLVLIRNLKFMEYQFIAFTITDGIAQLKLNRADKLNAICFRMVEEIRHALTHLDTTTTKALFVVGHEKAFSAGGDLKEMKTLTQQEAERRSQFIHESFQLFQKLPIPTIAFISGVCLGGGLELALHCDVRICTQTARLALPELQYGIIPGAGGTVQLPLQLGHANAAFYLFTGADIPLELALQQGLIQQLLSVEQFPEVQKNLACHFSNTELEALKAVKEQLQRHRDGTSLTERYQQEAACFATLLANHGKDGIGDRF
ncbi:MAG: hypothetical protein A2W84_11130 [Bacteroidetes bacterium GWC2_40_13]|nr:MAG: hypothetical protein A2W84_11130 [Bacteroidetes bacterium GWC2_40_13]